MGQDRRWELLDRAEAVLLERLADRNVTEVRFVAAFPDLDDFSVWLCTATDAERNRLGDHLPLLAEVRRALLEVGFTEEEVAGLQTTAEAQETVDRDYEGSWFYAMR